ncbi:MAG: phage major capsid protein [Hydrogenophilales bacterium]|nr:phage major capsid protein [Hydrogenophilales bacterium]
MLRRSPKSDRAGLRGSEAARRKSGHPEHFRHPGRRQWCERGVIGNHRISESIAALQAILAADEPTPTAAIMSPRSLTTLAGLLDTTNQPRRAPQILEPWKILATSQIPNNLTVGTSTDCSEIYVGDFSNLVYFIREGVSIQPLKELHAGTGEIGFCRHTRADVGLLYPARCR